MKFQGKTAIVTGAAQGIGAAVARQLAQGGAKTLLVDIDAAALARTAEKLAQAGLSDCLTYQCDVSDEGAVEAMAAYARENLGKIDILVNNAGIYRDESLTFLESNSSKWKKKLEVNVLGTLYVTHAVLGDMLARGYGRIVNLASVVAVYGKAYMVDYSMTKGAIVSFTKALAKEVTGQGVLVNAVSPGTIQVEADEAALNSDYSFVGRCGTPEECANLICFLASDDASYISGQNYLVDGLRRAM